MQNRQPKKQLLLAGVVAGAAWGSLAGIRADETVLISLETVKPAYRLHEPILVDLLMTNPLREEVKLDPGPEHLRLVVTTEDRRRAVLTRPPAEGIAPISRVTLKPGHVERRRVLLNEWYSFDKPGAYAVEVGLDRPAETAGGVSIPAPASRAITIKVLPRDAAGLKAVCEKLAETAIGSSDVETASEAARALSYVRDPVAVPFLERVLKKAKLVRYHALAGLARIANAEAVRALIAATKEEDPELRSQAVYALSQAKANAQDEALKRKIEEALSGRG